jgi:Kinesin motor domain
MPQPCRKATIANAAGGSSTGFTLQSYTFDAVIGQTGSQAEVFEAIGMPMVQHTLDGFNATVMAYGQTSSGKTYTMHGLLHESDAQVCCCCCSCCCCVFSASQTCYY